MEKSFDQSIPDPLDLGSNDIWIKTDSSAKPSALDKVTGYAGPNASDQTILGSNDTTCTYPDFIFHLCCLTPGFAWLCLMFCHSVILFFAPHWLLYTYLLAGTPETETREGSGEDFRVVS